MIIFRISHIKTHVLLGAFKKHFNDKFLLSLKNIYKFRQEIFERFLNSIYSLYPKFNLNKPSIFVFQNYQVFTVRTP